MEDRKKLGIQAGDTVRVWQKIQEKGKTRRQAFEGLVLERKHGNEPGATFTVRRVASGVGVEKIFPLYSPMIDKIEIIKRSKVRRAKLYYIREKAAKEIRRQMRRMTLLHLSTLSEMEEKEKAEKATKEAEEAAAKEAEDVKKAEEETVKEELSSDEAAEDKGVKAEAEKKETPQGDEVIVGQAKEKTQKGDSQELKKE